MHEHVEIILPPRAIDDLPHWIAQVLAPFDENNEEPDGTPSFWDWYQIGGRWSGAKVEAALNPERKAAFFAELERRQTTFSGVQFGKPQLSPGTQIVAVDALYREFFPGHGDVCPFFEHFRADEPPESISPVDVCTVVEIPERLSCQRLMLAGEHPHNPSLMRAEDMLAQSLWNGLRHQDTKWGGNVRSGLAEFRKRRPLAATHDCLAVTVDAHH